MEAAADVVETFGPGPWEHFVLAPCRGRTVPAVALELRLITELYRDRPDRSEPLLAHLAHRGCDVGLVKRGMDYAGIDPERQRVVFNRLGRPAGQG